MRTSIFCWAGILLLALPGCGDDSDTDPPDDDKEICDNGQDDDADGLVDCTDSDCAAGCAATCGNGAVDPGEACDGADLGGQTCEGLGYPGGTLACASSCTLDPSGCDPVSDACGDGAVDAGEACDGADLGGQTCESLGFDGGTLACSATCTLDESGCTSGPTEVCGNGQDDNGNGLSDCEDPACAGEASCSGDSCSAPIPLADSMPASSDTTGGTETSSGTCTGPEGTPARVHAFTAGGNPGELGLLHIELESITDQGLYVRTDCADEASEVGCTDAYAGGTNEVLDLPIEGGQTIYIYVDAWAIPEDAGPYTLTATWTLLGDEDICDDLEDNDLDGLPDCADPTCQATPTCEPGMTPTGSPCDAHDQCVANDNDPLCLGESTSGWPEGYCSEFCDLAQNDCPSGAVCAPAGLPAGNGRCLDQCATHSECRPDYHCDSNLGGCLPGDPPEVCDNGVDDNGNGQVDCEDPGCQGDPVCPEDDCGDFFDNDDDGYFDCDDAGCQATAACVPGMGAIGAPCSANTECAANGNDPLCLAEQLTGWQDGYCAEFCDLAANDCASGASCVDMGLPSGNGYCLDQCATSADCRPGYSCDASFGNVCIGVDLATEICDNGVDDSGDGLVDCEDPSCEIDPACPESVCDDITDNDRNGMVDCQDPLCQATATCTPGMGAAGATCAVNSDCAADASDPFCITEAWLGWPGGYCSQFCDLANDDCPSGEVCLDAAVSPTAGICFDLCTMDADCRAGYGCLAVGGGVNICLAN